MHAGGGLGEGGEGRGMTPVIWLWPSVACGWLPRWWIPVDPLTLTTQFKGQGVTKSGAHQRTIQGGGSQEIRSQSQLGDKFLVPQLPLCCLRCQGLELQMGSRSFVKLLAEPSPASYRTALQYEAFVEGGRENLSP